MTERLNIIPDFRDSSPPDPSDPFYMTLEMFAVPHQHNVSTEASTDAKQ